jgi:putative ABC transport system permease protein
MQQKYPEIIDYCGIRSGYSFRCSITKEDGSTMELVNKFQYGATESFPSFFEPKIITGDVQRFREPDKVIITESYAKQIFGNINPVGQNVSLTCLESFSEEAIDRIPRLLTITAVCKDFPDNCSLANGIYYNIKSDPVDFKSQNTFDYKAFIRVSSAKRLDEIAKQWLKKMEFDYIGNACFFPLKTFHFSEAGTGNLTASLSLLFVGIAALIIAWINFINFSMSMAPSRVKSINVQKIFGANTRPLRLVIASESVFFSLIAFLLAVIFTGMIHKLSISEFFSANLALNANLQVIIFAGIFIVLFGFIPGLYPAYYATSFKPVAALSGSPLKTNKKTGLKNILTTVQFTAAVVLIIIVVIVKQQYSYAVNYSYGFERKNILYLDAGKLTQNDRHAFVTELINGNPQILDFTSSYFIPCIGGYSSRTREFEGKQINYGSWFVQENFMRFFDIPVIEGHDFIDTPIKSWSQMIVNEKLAKQMDTSSIIGKKFDNCDVIGVMKNINFTSLHHPVSPMGIAKGGYDLNIVFFKIIESETKKTIAHIRAVWNKFNDEPLEVNFLDTQLASLYKRENNLANLLTIVSMVTIIIAIMGVYGMIVLNIRKKEKEIALRKICGASFKDIILLLNRGALIQLIIAFVVAAPVAYYIANRWLETFAYKISIRWWVSVLCWLFMCIITLTTICMQTYRAAVKKPVEAIKNE